MTNCVHSEQKGSGEHLSPGFVVVFESAETEFPEDPIPFTVMNQGQYEHATNPHGLPVEFSRVLPVLWYCLHLPQTELDVLDLQAGFLKARQELDYPHEILLLPLPMVDSFDVGIIRRRMRPGLVFCPDPCYERLLPFCARLGVPNPPVRFSEANGARLADHWKMLTSAAPDQILRPPPVLIDRLDFAATLLPLRLLLRQFGHLNIPTPSSEEGQRRLQEHALRSQIVLAATAQMEEERLDPQSAEVRFPSELEKQADNAKFPVSLALPGIPPRYKRNLRTYAQAPTSVPWTLIDADHRLDGLSLSTSHGQIERAAIDFVTAHRAIARSGVALSLPFVPAPAYEQLAQLEAHLVGGAARPKGVWKLLGGISDAMTPILTNEVLGLVSRASLLNVFSSFPLGLVILPGDSAPLSCRVPIAYRPLLPLMRTIQTEIAAPPMLYWREGFRLLIVEAVPEDDPVGKLSRATWKLCESAHQGDARIEIVVRQVASAQEFRDAVQDVGPSMLIVSAHGHYDEALNIAGVMIGNEFCIGPELGPLPPLVVLSACHTAPRAKGAVNIGDLLIREGAIAILTSMVPVGVAQNGILMSRFLINMLDALGRSDRNLTIADVWHHTATSNMINDIAFGNRQLSTWMQGSPRRSPLVEFMSRRSVGRIRQGHAYNDAVAVLREIALEDGVAEKFDEWMRYPGYYPESLFYGFVGWPERIFLHSKLVERFRPGPGKEFPRPQPTQGEDKQANDNTKSA